MSFDTNNCYDKESSTYIDNQQEQQQLQEFSTKPGTQHGFQPTLSNNSNNDVSPKVKGKRRAAQELSGNNAPCYIQQLSLEIIIHIFSHLDPVSLSTASTVCHYWRHIVTDDNCWKNAFCAYFGALPFKRLRPDSWKSEYILRAHLLRKWEKGRGTVMQFKPRIGSIDAMSVDFEHSSVLVASSELGMAVKCNPATGKVDRHRLYSTDDGVPMRVSVVKMDGQRILWGFHAGFVTMTVRTKSVVGRQLKVFAEFHQGCVTALDLPTFTSDVALSASETGNIKIWDILTGTCVQNLYGNGSTPTFLQALKPFGVLSGSANGTVTYWNINVNELAKKHRELHRRQDLLERTTPSVASTADVRVQPLVIAAPPSNEATPVHTIKHDSETNVIVVTYEGCQEVWKYDLNTGNCLGVFGGGHLIGAISCMQWDLAPVTSTTSSSLQAALRPRSKKTLSLSNGSNSNQGTPVTTKSMRILATGDTVGTICLWDGDAVEQDGRQIKPLRVMTGHAAAISVLFIDACKLVSGSDDGWIRIWDPITGTLLNVLSNKVPKNAPIDRSDVSVMRVKNIFCDDYRGVATVGHQVKTWDFSPDKQLLDKRNLKPKTRFPGADTRQLHYEIKQDLKESTEALKQEKKEREREARELHKMTLGGLSDSELLEYALMLSKEVSNSQDPSLQPNGSGGSSSGNFSAGDYVEDDEALLSAVMASLDMENQAVSNSLPSRSPVDWREDEWPSVTETNNSSSRSSRAGSDGSVWGNVHSRVLEPFHSDTSSPRFRIAAEDDEYDEELQYVLKLSESEK